VKRGHQERSFGCRLLYERQQQQQHYTSMVYCTQRNLQDSYTYSCGILLGVQGQTEQGNVQKY
jgi:hypothetical protein